MQNLKSVDPAAATGQTKQIFEGLQKSLGTVPNLMRTLANSPAALNAYMSFNAALSEAALSPKLREQLAIAVANMNTCDYCLSAHNALGKLAGLSADELALAQNAEAADPKAGAALRFAAAVVRKRGVLGTADVKALRDAGFTDGEIAETVAVVAINIFTNYFNHIAGTEIDFPVVKSTSARYDAA
jgi:uncharacterized peroxidase-related enzyme